MVFCGITTGLLQLPIGLHCVLVSCMASDRLHIWPTDGLFCLLAGCIAYWCTVWPTACGVNCVLGCISYQWTVIPAGSWYLLV